jgi:ABC-type Fe3+-siderophore transport system permease subunit
LPAATAAGAILLALADAASRGLAQQNLLGSQLQVGILTGLLGGPFFLVLLAEGKALAVEGGAG